MMAVKGWKLWINISIFIISNTFSTSVRGQPEKSADNENYGPLKYPSDLEIPPLQDVTNSTAGEVEYVCNESDSRSSIIYCQGTLLHTVMMLHLYVDSKSYVDKPLKKSPEEVMDAFIKKFSRPIKYADREEVRAFMDENFNKVGDELLECQLPDWQSKPPKLLTIRNRHLRKFAIDINEIWSRLCRKMRPEVNEYPERRSLIYVPNHFVVPGGRFREFYYWDTYWIVKGLLVSGLYETTKAMLGNFKHMVDKLGFVPNGGRLYYLRRSQPPFFIPMVFEYYKATQDKEFLLSILPTMRKEFEFWRSRRMIGIEGKSYKVFQYRADSNVPRPESYREDYETAKQVKQEQKHILWRHIASAAESGWDFSSRWFDDHKRLSTIVTAEIAPVDLNAILCWNMGILAYLHNEIGEKEWGNRYHKMHKDFMEIFKEVFYDADEGAWYDYNLRTGFLNDAAFPSMAVPLFSQCYDPLDTEMAASILRTLRRRGLLQFPGGVPTSIKKGTAQQWDYPNGWAPINHMLIEGLRKSSDPELQQEAFRLATRWISRNYHVYMAEHIMWEKYDVSKQYIKQAKGGEYENQAGFGWTNGVVLDLMVSYADQMDVEPLGFDNATFEYLDDDESDGQLSSTHIALIPIVLITLIAMLHNVMTTYA